MKHTFSLTREGDACEQCGQLQANVSSPDCPNVCATGDLFRAIEAQDRALEARMHRQDFGDYKRGIK